MYEGRSPAMMSQNTQLGRSIGSSGTRFRQSGSFASADFIHLQVHISVSVEFKGRRETGSPDDLVVTIRIASVDGLSECVVKPFHHHQQFRLQPLKVLAGLAQKGTIFINRMHYCPCERKEV